MSVCISSSLTAPSVYWSGCFPSSELIQVEKEFFAPMGSLKIGDKICTSDIEKGRQGYTSIIAINKYEVNEMVYINKNIKTSSSHPFYIMEMNKNRLLIPVWKVAYDIMIGDYMVNIDGRLIEVFSKTGHFYANGIEVFNLGTANGDPYSVGGSVVRAENARMDKIDWCNLPRTQGWLAEAVA